MPPTTTSSPSPNKKRRMGEASSTAKKNRTKAKAEGFGTNDFPVDILYEIVTYLEPRDLVSVSRTSKPLHLALTSKSSSFLWKRAIRRAKLPPCPKDLNEMRYIRFACDNSCDYCGKRPGRWGDLHRMYGNRRKACKTCMQTFGYASSKLYYLPGIFIPEKRRRGGNGWGQREGDFYVPEEERAAVNARLAEVSDDEKAKSALLKEMEREMDKMNEIKHELDRWLEKEEKREEDRKKLVRHPRYHEVVDKLKALGWADDLEWMHSEKSRYKDHGLHTVKNVNIPSRLTPAGWATLKPDVLDFMEKVRRSHFEEMRSDRVPLFLKAYNNYVRKRPYDPYGPSSADIADQPEVSALIFAPLSVSVSQKDFDQLLGKSFDDLRTKWRVSAEEKLVEVMERKIPDASTEHLRSPATSFSCRDCRQELLFPHVLTHARCVSREDSKFGRDLNVAPWDHSKFKFEYEMYMEAQAVLEKLDEAPSANMLSLELFECLNCATAFNRRVFMTWNEAMSMKGCFCVGRRHRIRKAILTPEERILKNLYVDLKISTSSSDRCIACAICHGSYGTIRGGNNTTHGIFADHQAHSHNTTKETWREGVDFYRRADAVDYVRFHEDFILNEEADVRDIVVRGLNKALESIRDSSRPTVPDIRMDTTFTEEVQGS